MGFGRSCCKVFTVSLVPVTVFTLAFLFFCGIILLPVLYSELAEKEQYGIVMDAGSTHTHIYLYTWKASQINTNSPVKEITSCRSPGSGISTYTNATEAGKSITPCLPALMKKVPKDYQKHLTVWFGATAGMRLLKFENATFAEDILEEVKKALKGKGVKHKHIHILGGGEEGATGWITANYMNNKLKLTYPKKRELANSHSLGALDMGGASMQIAFEHESSDPTHRFTADLFGERWQLYSRSYLCFGIVEAFRRTLAHISKMNDYNTSSPLKHPCMSDGSYITKTMGYMFDNHFCTQDLEPPEEDDYYIDDKITFIGSSNPLECFQLISKTSNFSHCFFNDSIEDCSTDQVPNVTEKNFWGFSEFYYASNFFNVTSINSTSFSKHNESFIAFCKKSIDQLKPKFPAASSFHYECFDALYMSYVLERGFGFRPNQGNWNIAFKQRFANIDAGWTLGYMLNKTSRIKDTPNYVSHPYTSTDLIVGMIVLTILSLVFLIFFAFTFSACRKALKPIATGYTNIS